MTGPIFSHRSTRPDVLIVGAGPVGLVLACELLSQGVVVRVVDTAPTRPKHSRAAIVWPRILEQLRRISVAQTMVEAGHHIDAVAYYSERRPLGEVSMAAMSGTPYPLGLTIPQDVTEAILTERLCQLGGEIERGTTLEAVSQDGPLVRALLRRSDGATEDLTVPWLVGADGAHSTVRKLLDIPFDGDAPEITFAIADAPVDGGHSIRRLHYFYSRAGAFGLAPLGDRLFRMAVSIPPRAADSEPPSRELFQELLTARGFGRVGQLGWSSAFTLRCRTAQRFRVGRCFLAGDAAHIMSPAGGQGMNTGILDAVDLGWKLGGVIRGALSTRVLDSYEQDRRRAALRVTRTTIRQTHWGLWNRPVKIAARDLAFRLAYRTGVVQRVGAPLMGQLSVGYGRSATLRDLLTPGRPRVGDRVAAFVADSGSAPDPRWPVIARDDLTVLLWPGRRRPEPWSRWRERVVAALPVGVPVADLGAGQPGRLTSTLGTLPAVLVVRPDGHLAGSIPFGDVTGLAGLVSAWRAS